MKAITEAIYTALTGDSTLRSIIGGSASDENIYRAYPALEKFDDVRSGSKSALIALRYSQSGQRRSDKTGEPDALLYMDFYSRSADTNQQALDRVLDMIDVTSLSVSGYGPVRIQYRSAQELNIGTNSNNPFLNHVAAVFLVWDVNRD